MKVKTLILSVLMLMSISAFSQTWNTQYYVTQLLIDETDATIYKEGDINGYYFTLTVLPSYYTFDIFKIIIKEKLSDYSDITLFKNWKSEIENGVETFSTMYVVDSEFFSISYMVEGNVQYVMYGFANN